MKNSVGMETSYTHALVIAKAKAEPVQEGSGRNTTQAMSIN